MIGMSIEKRIAGIPKSDALAGEINAGSIFHFPSKVECDTV